MTPAEVESTPIGSLTVDEVIDHLFARASTRAMVVGVETEERLVLRWSGPVTSSIGLLAMIDDEIQTKLKASE
jgi:hypothetical protein